MITYLIGVLAMMPIIWVAQRIDAIDMPESSAMTYRDIAVLICGIGTSWVGVFVALTMFLIMGLIGIGAGIIFLCDILERSSFLDKKPFAKNDGGR